MSVGFVNVLYKIQFKCHVNMCVVCPVLAVGLRTMMYVPYADNKLVPISKLKSIKD